jgi:hypothetical protein
MLSNYQSFRAFSKIYLFAFVHKSRKYFFLLPGLFITVLALVFYHGKVDSIEGYEEVPDVQA